MGSLFNYSGRHVLKTCIPKPTILRITSPHLTYPLRALLRIKDVFFPILASGQQCEANSTPPISKKKALVDYVLSLLTEVSWNVSYNFLLLVTVSESVIPWVRASTSP